MVAPSSDPAAPTYQIVRVTKCGVSTLFGVGTVPRVVECGPRRTTVRFAACDEGEIPWEARHFWLDAESENVNLAVQYGELEGLGLGSGTGSLDAPRYVTTFWARHSGLGPGAGPSPGGGRKSVEPVPALVRLRSLLLLGE